MQNALKEAENKYPAELDTQLTLELRINTDRVNKADAVAQAQAKVAVAEANLADAQSRLDQLKNGPDPDDLLSAQVRLQAAQATVESPTIKAPFNGEVLVVNYRPGDVVSPSLAAVLIANHSHLHVEAPIDETQIARIQVGEAVTITLDPLGGLALPGTVEWINPVGNSVQRVEPAPTNSGNPFGPE